MFRSKRSGGRAILGTWGGFHPTGFLTLARPGERLALVEYLYNEAVRVLETRPADAKARQVGWV